MKQEEVKEIADWCLNCKDRPCAKIGCPINTNIPEFIEEIKRNNYEKAYNILLDNNVFSHICSIICPQENQCEGSCIRGIKQTSTKIGKLENYINEWAKKNNCEYKINLKNKNGKKVAVVGSGPAGLECAFELLKNGYDVTIFEKEKAAGGVLTYGIPDFRLSKKLVNETISKIKDLGVEIKTGIEFGKEIKLEELKKQYDAVFLGIGATKSLTYRLSQTPQEYLNGIYKSDEFLKKYNENKKIENLGTVIVIGGGNVAMDSARVAVKMGASKVKILYRRDFERMPARESELKDCIEYGIEIEYLTKVVSANSKDGNVKSLNCVKTKIIDGKAVEENGTEFIEDADTVIFAIGLKPERELLEKEGIRLNDFGYIEIDESGQTNIKGVYAGGDDSQSKSTVCRAISDGRKAANGIMKQFLGSI